MCKGITSDRFQVVNIAYQLPTLNLQDQCRANQSKSHTHTHIHSLVISIHCMWVTNFKFLFLYCTLFMWHSVNSTVIKWNVIGAFKIEQFLLTLNDILKFMTWLLLDFLFGRANDNSRTPLLLRLSSCKIADDGHVANYCRLRICCKKGVASIYFNTHFPQIPFF